MTEAQRYEIYLMRRYFNMTAHQTLYETPTWEIDICLEGLAHERRGE